MRQAGKASDLFFFSEQNITKDELILLLENMISPFSYHRMVYDENARPVDCIFLAVNQTFEQETGKKRADVIGKNVMSVYPLTESYWIECFGRVAKTGVSEQLTEYAAAFDKWFNARVYSPNPDHFAITITDVSQFVRERESLLQTAEKLKAQQDENYRLSHEEPITGLPNRACLYESFHEIESICEKQHFSVAIFTPDNLAEILASYGSMLSDQIMHAVAQRVRDLCSVEDTVYSMTGTDIVLLLPSSCDTQRTQKTLARVHKAIRAPVEIEGNNFMISATCGVSCYPKDGTSRDELIMKANLALYQAKKSGLNTVFFNELIAQKLLRRTKIRNELPKALEHKEFELFFQPQVKTSTGRPLGFEALLRWHNAGLHNPSPLEFIGVAEESRLILPLGAWVLKTACRTLRQINDQYHTDFFMAVNVSGVQLATEGFSDLVYNTLAETCLPPEQLELEVTESVLLNREMSVIEKLNALHEKGIRIALDDFGTGYSSLSHIKDLEITTLKIDKSFVQDPRSGSLTETMVRLGHMFGAEIVAEGVETQEQLAFVLEAGCERVQGFFEAKPMPLRDLKCFIEGKLSD